MRKAWKRAALVFLATALITACGGGGSSDFLTSGGDSPNLSGPQMGAIIDGVFQPRQLALSVDADTILAPGSSLTVTALIVDEQQNPYADPVEVEFTTNFADTGLAEIEELKTTVNGEAVSVYKARGGEGIDTISATAEVEGRILTATATVIIAGNAAAHVEFVSASHEFLALRNTGGPPRSETSVLTFRVTDTSANPVAGQTVDFRLSTAIGDLFLSAESDISDAAGVVQTTVNAGTVSTEIKVHATLRGSVPLVTVVSDTLLVSTGLADQNSISIAPDVFNPEAWDYNNVAVEVVFQAADHFNNFVPDGTVVYFTTELGSINASCTFTDGVCTPKWRSGNPRDSYCDDLDVESGGCRKGVSTILAFLIGEESFVDFNGNGYFDPGDVFDTTTDMGEPFRDDNDNGIRDDFEPWWDYNANGLYDGPNGIYNGSLCSDEAEDLGLCTKELVYVQAVTRIVMSGSFADTFTLAAGPGPGWVTVIVADVNGNPMPKGSTVGIIDDSSGSSVAQFKIPNTLTQTTYAVRVYETGTFSGQITTPFDNVSYSSNTITIN